MVGVAQGQATVTRRPEAARDGPEALGYGDRWHKELPCSAATGTAEEAVEAEGEAATELDAAGMSAQAREVEVDEQKHAFLMYQEVSRAREREATGELEKSSVAHGWSRSVGSVTIQHWRYMKTPEGAHSRPDGHTQRNAEVFGAACTVEAQNRSEVKEVVGATQASAMHRTW